MLLLTGCSGKKSPMSADYEPTRDGPASQRMGGPQGIVEGTTLAQNKPDNPKFITAKNIQLKSDAAKALDALLRPALKKLFKDVKIISEGEMPQYREGIIDTFKYVPKARITEQDGVPLHSLLSGEYRFSPSVRLGTKPTVTSKWMAMSFIRYTGSGTNYSIALYIDLAAQVIRVESYELGSRYDRMM
jgi:hypothetical protein